MTQLISLLVENKPGALMRVAGVLTSRGYNIESLTVAKTLDPTLSSMTIVAQVSDENRPLLIKQITRLGGFDQLLVGRRAPDDVADSGRQLILVDRPGRSVCP